MREIRTRDQLLGPRCRVAQQLRRLGKASSTTPGRVPRRIGMRVRLDLPAIDKAWQGISDAPCLEVFVRGLAMNIGAKLDTGPMFQGAEEKEGSDNTRTRQNKKT